VTFEEEGKKTRLTVREKAVALQPIAGAMLARMETGWAQSLYRLETVVAKV